MAVPLDIEAKVLTAGAEQAKTQADFVQAKQLYIKALAAVERAHGKLSMEAAVICMDIAEMFEESGDSIESHKYVERMKEIVNYQKNRCENPLMA